MQQGQRLPSAQKRVWLWDGSVWLGLVEEEAPLLYRNRGPLPGKSCPPVLLKDGRRGKTFLEILSPVRIRRVIPPYPKINYNSLTAVASTKPFPGSLPLLVPNPFLAQWKRIHLPVQELQVRSLDREGPLEKEMATHSRILAWRIP